MNDQPSTRYLRKKALEAASSMVESSKRMDPVIEDVILGLMPEINPLLDSPPINRPLNNEPDQVDFINATHNIIDEELDPSEEHRQSWRADEKYHEQTLRESHYKVAGCLSSFMGRDDIPVSCLHYIPHAQIGGCFQICNKPTEVKCKQCEGIHFISK
jgi:hypothetical protein